jgi:ADP-heptose:LPS heptosyltransferase
MREKILLVRLKSMGDVVLTLPAVNLLRDNFPGAKITFLTSQENAALLRGFHAVDEVITLDRAALRSRNPFRVAAEFFGLLRRLRAGKFDFAIDLQGYGETAWLTRITGASQRWGLLDRPGYGWAFTRQIAPDLNVHPAEWHRRLLLECGLKPGAVRNEFALPETALNEARAWFAAHQLNPAKPTLYLQPFTSGAHKNWPLENYLAVARHWREAGLQIIFGGGPADRAALESVGRGGFALSAGVPLLVTGGLMQLSTLVLGGDTGALHLAVALGKPVLMLMHYAPPGSPTPFQHRDWILVAPRPVAIAEIPVATVNIALAARLEP